jgi:NAD(P)H-dependent FMN reductase
MSATPKIGIILSTTRPNRFADKAAQWLLKLAKQRDGVAF